MHKLRILSERDIASTDSNCIFVFFQKKTFFYLLEKFLIHVEKILFVKIKTLIIFFKKATFLRMKIFWHLLETVSKENIYNCLKQSKICIYKV